MKAPLVTCMLLSVGAPACWPAPPRDALCAYTEGAEAVSCVAGALNEALGCEIYTAAGLTLHSAAPDGPTIQVAFVEEPIVGESGSYKGWYEPGSIRVLTTHGPALIAPTLMHELGHAIGLRFPDNAADPIHSLNPDDLMYTSGPQSGWLTRTNLAAMVAQAQDLHLCGD